MGKAKRLRKEKMARRKEKNTLHIMPGWDFSFRICKSKKPPKWQTVSWPVQPPRSGRTQVAEELMDSMVYCNTIMLRKTNHDTTHADRRIVPFRKRDAIANENPVRYYKLISDAMRRQSAELEVGLF